MRTLGFFKHFQGHKAISKSYQRKLLVSTLRYKQGMTKNSKFFGVSWAEVTKMAHLEKYEEIAELGSTIEHPVPQSGIEKGLFLESGKSCDSAEVCQLNAERLV